MFAKKSGEFSKENSWYKMPRTAFYTSCASAPDRLFRRSCYATLPIGGRLLFAEHMRAGGSKSA